PRAYSSPPTLTGSLSGSGVRNRDGNRQDCEPLTALRLRREPPLVVGCFTALAPQGRAASRTVVSCSLPIFPISSAPGAPLLLVSHSSYLPLSPSF
ncbi:hypothetical protein QUB80_29365, partial [Chlorogloeopsis sp. ULAP01]|uniref:hypothetical protein n=1 Tax=Chlorogloeopsis sp. ULAP01 TaxID=3056483 RepID=UPI0025AA9144